MKSITKSIQDVTYVIYIFNRNTRLNGVRHDYKCFAVVSQSLWVNQSINLLNVH